MKLHYMGKYDLDPDSLPHLPHMPGAVPFREAKDSASLGKLINTVAMLLLIPVLVPLWLRWGSDLFYPPALFAGGLLSLAVMFPHELLHALCFREDVYVYTNLKQGMLFVVGPETMSKGRFILMSLAPNIVFGFIPYALALCFPGLTFLGVLGALSIVLGTGDYYNVINAATQMPRGARTYLHKFNSFWYMPGGAGADGGQNEAQN